jgi:hypothetical protein
LKDPQEKYSYPNMVWYKALKTARNSFSELGSQLNSAGLQLKIQIRNAMVVSKYITVSPFKQIPNDRAGSNIVLKTRFTPSIG